MYRDLLEFFGLDLYGVNFERAVWMLAILLSLWGLYGAWLAFKEKDKADAALRGVISAAVLLWAGQKAYLAFFKEGSYALFFGEEVVIHTYAFAIVSGFVVGVYLAVREGHRVGIKRSQILDISFWCLIAGLVGARALYIIVSIDDYVRACTEQGDCLMILRFWQGGIVFYGSFIGAGLAMVIYAKRQGIKLPLLVDTGVPSLALGHAFGRFGCMGAGCCWGESCTGNWGVHFGQGDMPYNDMLQRFLRGDTNIDPAILDGDTGPLHPTQLYEAFGELMIFAFLIYWRPRKRVHGELLALWMAIYGFFRTFTEIFRGDKVRGYLVEITIEPLNALLQIPSYHPTFLTTSQIIGLALGFGGLGFFFWLRKRGAKQRALLLGKAATVE